MYLELVMTWEIKGLGNEAESIGSDIKFSILRKLKERMYSKIVFLIISCHTQYRKISTPLFMDVYFSTTNHYPLSNIYISGCTLATRKY